MKKKTVAEHSVFHRNEKGITLIALIITIIILVILAAVSINAAYNSGIINYAANGTQEYAEGAHNEQSRIANAEEVLTSAINRIDSVVNGRNGQDSSGPTVTIGGTQVILTPDNVSEYMGKIVTNYKTPNSTEQITIDENTYTVSTTYRLYYVDFDNKYGDGEGTVYLKADPAGDGDSLMDPDTYEVFEGNLTTSKIRQFNKLLYSDESLIPEEMTEGLRASSWLLDPDVWDGLVSSSAGLPICNKINYIVGAPSIELMMDSYNTCYGLTDEDIDYNERTEETTNRTKLLYRRTREWDWEGGYVEVFSYDVGPDLYGTDGFSCGTSNYTLLPDENVGEMYCSSENHNYYIASPCLYDGDIRIYVGADSFVGYDYNNFGCGTLCPIVSLSPGVNLEFEG